MSVHYIPRGDEQAKAWMQNFASKLSADPAAYMISAAEAAGIQSAVDAFVAALADANDPFQRSPVIVATKDEMRNAAEQLCRQYATLIKMNAGISNPDKISAGVRPINPNRDPRPCPQTAPKLNVVAATFGVHTLKFSDALTEESGAKPFGATELQLFVAIGDAATQNPGDGNFYNKFTKNPLTVAFAHEYNGKMASYFGRWAGQRGDFGPWSNPVSLAIAA